MYVDTKCVIAQFQMIRSIAAIAVKEPMIKILPEDVIAVTRLVHKVLI